MPDANVPVFAARYRGLFSSCLLATLLTMLMRYRPQTKLYADFLHALRLTHEQWVERWIAEALRLSPPEMRTLLEHDGRVFDDINAATPEQQAILQQATSEAMNQRIRELRELDVVPRGAKSGSRGRH